MTIATLAFPFPCARAPSTSMALRKASVLDAQEARLRVIGHDHRGVLHGELLEDDPQGRAGGHGRSVSGGGASLS